MASQDQSAIRDHFRESRIVNNRLIFAAVFSFILFSLVILRLVVLQVVEYEHFDSLSDRNRVDIEPLPPKRGLIYDRNGVVLAENIPTFSLELVPEKVTDLASTLSKLRQLIRLSDEEVADFHKRYKRQRGFEQVTVKYQLTDREVARFSVNRHRFPGVDVEGRLIRHYPHGELFSHVLGYVGRINQSEMLSINPQNYRGTEQIGKTGVEKEYETLLLGRVGHRQVETNVQGRQVRELSRVPPQSGRDLYLHLDINLQQTAADALGDENGAVVAMDPRNGGVLAMVSKPDFDPNKFVTGISTKDYSALRDNPEQPLYDRALRGNYPPGSVIKPFVALAGLEQGIVTEHSETFCPGWYSLPGHSHRYRCWKEHGHGHMNMQEAVAQSCDVYFYELAHKLGIDRMHQFLDLFGYGRRTGIDLPGESAGLSPSSEWKRNTRNQAWYPGETLISGIGQGFNQATPLQLAQITSVLAMRGAGSKPQVVRASRMPGSESLDLMSPVSLDNLPMQDSDNWEAAVQSMVNVVHGDRGTARHIGKDLPFEIAGKTGTAQVFGIAQDEKYDADTLEKKLHDHALFVAFAPADKPEFAVAVIVENGGSGSKTAAPIAKRLIRQHFGLENDELSVE